MTPTTIDNEIEENIDNKIPEDNSALIKPRKRFFNLSKNRYLFLKNIHLIAKNMLSLHGDFIGKIKK